jgi:hypothetical protein
MLKIFKTTYHHKLPFNSKDWRGAFWLWANTIEMEASRWVRHERIRTNKLVCCDVWVHAGSGGGQNESLSIKRRSVVRWYVCMYVGHHGDPWYVGTYVCTSVITNRYFVIAKGPGRSVCNSPARSVSKAQLGASTGEQPSFRAPPPPRGREQHLCPSPGDHEVHDWRIHESFSFTTPRGRSPLIGGLVLTRSVPAFCSGTHYRDAVPAGIKRTCWP